MKFFREPLVHFMLIGAVIYLSYGLVAEPEVKQDDNRIVVSVGELEWMTSSWEKRWNRMPTEAELQSVIDQYVKEMVLYREALTMGLDQNDTVIRRRLAQKVEFLAKDLASYVPSSDEELEAYFNKNIENYRKSETFTFAQVFVDPDKRGDATLSDAEAIKTKLNAKKIDITKVYSLGDGLMLENYYTDETISSMRKVFGSDFTESVIKLHVGKWQGPVLSGFGVHLVYIESRTPAPEPLLADMRERVQQDWLDEKREEINNQFYSALRGRYTVVIEKADGSSTGPTSLNTSTAGLVESEQKKAVQESVL